jgi:hypothetical protein
VLTGLTVLGDTSLELTNTGGDNQHSAISLEKSMLETPERQQHESQSIPERYQ